MEEMEKKLNAIIEENKKLAEKVSSIDKAMVSAGVYDQAKIKQGFEDLKQNPACFDYAKVFYWNILNYLTAYRNLATGLIEQKEEEDRALEKAGSMIKDAALDVASGIPFVGGLFKLLDQGISAIYGAYEMQEKKDKINMINEIITHNQDTILDSDISLRCASAALKVAKAKEYDINNYDEKRTGFSGLAESAKNTLI